MVAGVFLFVEVFMVVCRPGEYIRVIPPNSQSGAAPFFEYKISEVHFIASMHGTRICYKLAGMPDLIDADRCERI